jgi:deoxyribodipyrimidine photo-lyase
LVDFDVASNFGNWAYIAGVGPDPRGGRIFNLNDQADRYDPDQSYRRRWLS